MKPRKLRIVVLIFVAIIIGGVIWWFTRTQGSMATASAQVTSAAKADAPKPVAQVVQVELPKAPAVPAKAETTDSKTEDTALVQAEIKATFQDMARIMREKGPVSFMVAYYPPAFIASQPADLVQRMLDGEAEMAGDPQEQEKHEKAAQKYDLLATMTPTFNAAGDKATYYDEANADGSPQKLAVLMKINGKWYWDADFGD